MVSGISIISNRLKEIEAPVVVCHIDADGLTSGAIMVKTLKQIGKDVEVLPIKQLDSSTKEMIPWDRDLVFVDLGSGQIDWTQDHVIIDHHIPIRETKYQFNAHYIGLNGSRDISASGLSYLVSRDLIGDSELAGPAVVGMMGDQMHPKKKLARLAVNTKHVTAMKGLTYFGRETRVLPVMLQYASDPFIPGMSGEIDNCYEFLKKLNIDPKLSYHDLSEKLRSNLIEELIKLASSRGVAVHNMLGEYFILPDWPKKTEMRDASEFSTLLNACGRHNNPKLGIDLILGKNVYDEAKKLLRIHRSLLRRGLDELESTGVKDYQNFQLFTSENIKPTIIGIVAGIALSARLVDPFKPIIAVSPDQDGWKISGRGTLELIEQGLNLSEALKIASKGIGDGGGHDIAAGAFISSEHLDTFLKRLDQALGQQRAL